jgi:hypothetical protein
MSHAHPVDSSVTLEELLSVATAKRVPLAAELAGYLLLEMIEHVDPNGGNLDMKSIFVGEEGSVVVTRSPLAAASSNVEASLREVLGKLLDASSSHAPALAATAKRTAGAGLSALTEEIETGLIPINRAAGRRALGRLARETRRVISGARPSPAPPKQKSEPAVPRDAPASMASRPEDASFDHEEEATTTRHPTAEPVSPALQGPPKHQAPTPRPSSDRFSQADVDQLIEQFGVSSEGDTQHARALGNIAGLEPTPAPKPATSGSSANPVSAESDVESLLAMGAEPFSPPREAGVKPRAERDVDDEPSRRSSWIVALLAMTTVGVGAYVAVHNRSTLMPLAASSTASTNPPLPVAIPTPTVCTATLIVTGAPEGAEILLGEGQAPVDVAKVPVGARLEFVATADGYAPKRVVIPAGQTWDLGSDGRPRYEAALQLDPSRSKAGDDNWPPGEPGSEVGGQGPPGTVHVVATPRGAEVWMLAGLGSQSRIERLGCNRDWDVLVAGPTTFRRKLHVPAASFVAEPAADGSAGASQTTVQVARVRAPL